MTLHDKNGIDSGAGRIPASRTLGNYMTSNLGRCQGMVRSMNSCTFYVGNSSITVVYTFVIFDITFLG